MVKEFYANIRDKNHPLNHIDSYVNGVHITITNDLLTQLFGIPFASPPFRMTSTNTVVADPDYNPITAQQFFGLRGRLMARDFGQPGIRARLLCYLYSFNIMPRASGLNKIRMTDLYFAYKMIFGLGNLPGIPLTQIIIKQMWNVVSSQNQDKGFVFPLLLSNIFRALHIPLRDEESREANSILDMDTMHHLHYTREVFEWRIVPGYHRQNEEEAAPHAQAYDQQMGDEEQQQEQPVPDEQQHGPADLNMAYITEQFGRIQSQLADQNRHIQAQFQAIQDQRQAIIGMGQYMWDMRHYQEHLSRHFNFPPPPPFDPSVFFPQQPPPDDDPNDDMGPNV